MSGGIVQLVATGVQDEWLTGKPEISFFRSNYKRYTHYASSVERQTLQGMPAAGGISTIRLEKKGDLVSYMYLTARDQNNALVANLDWSQVIDRIQLYIGGQEIDSQDFQWMSDVEPVVGSQNSNQRYLNNVTPSTYQPTSQVATFFPLKFWFNKDWMVALPVVALAFHDVEVRITWSKNLGNQLNSTLNGTSTTSGVNSGTSTYASLSYQLWTNFIYLDAAEREYFAKTDMDVLITQVQRVPIGSQNVQELALAHPIKYLAFQAKQYCNVYSYNTSTSSITVGGFASSTAANYTIRQQINGSDVGEDKHLAQYMEVPQYYHTQFSYLPSPTGLQYVPPVAIIPFCLETGKLQPTGTLNFSRLDTYRLITPVQLASGLLTLCQPSSTYHNVSNAVHGLRGVPGINYLYAVNYNILRIQKGMGGLLYAN
jgi:hypothetical protein